MSKRDWSSDVCSSDLAGYSDAELEVDPLQVDVDGSGRLAQVLADLAAAHPGQIGRASCRERVSRSGGAGAGKRKIGGHGGQHASKQDKPNQYALTKTL